MTCKIAHFVEARIAAGGFEAGVAEEFGDQDELSLAGFTDQYFPERWRRLRPDVPQPDGV